MKKKILATGILFTSVLGAIAAPAAAYTYISCDPVSQTCTTYQCHEILDPEGKPVPICIVVGEPGFPA